MAYTVFIGHSCCDQDLAAKVSDLVRDVGAQPIDWTFESETQTASNIPDSIREADEVVLLVTTHSAENPWLHWEIGLASALDKEITTVIEGIDPSDLPPPLNHLRALDRRKIEKFRRDLAARISLCGEARTEIEMHPSAVGRLLPRRRSVRGNRQPGTPPNQVITK